MLMGKSEAGIVRVGDSLLVMPTRCECQGDGRAVCVKGGLKGRRGADCL